MINNKIIAAVAIVAIVIVAAASFAFIGDDKDNGEKDADLTYYFYLDGMGDNNGWHSAKGDNVKSAFETAMKNDGVKYTFNKSMVSFEGFESSSGTDANGNWIGTGYSIYLYTSTDMANYYSGYFVAGPALQDVASNIVYISYGDYTMDGKTYVTEYKLSPTTTSAKISEGGPFIDADYKPVSYDMYYFYLDGMGDNNGWYSGEGSDAKVAFEAAMNKAGIKYSISSKNMVSFEGFESSSTTDANGNWMGTGYSIYLYTSADMANYYSGYFAAGPSLPKVSSNIVYISYGDYTMDGKTYVTTYSVTPEKNSELSSTGPFA